jgi:hypothetical protein
MDFLSDRNMMGVTILMSVINLKKPEGSRQFFKIPHLRKTSMGKPGTGVELRLRKTSADKAVQPINVLNRKL